MCVLIPSLKILLINIIVFIDTYILGVPDEIQNLIKLMSHKKTTCSTLEV